MAMVEKDGKLSEKDERYCPGCKADLRGNPIPEKYFIHDRESEAHKRSVEFHKSFNLSSRECNCLPYGEREPEDRFYSRLVGVEISTAYDGILFWMCPDCGAQWHRWPEGDRLRAVAARYMDSPVHV